MFLDAGTMGTSSLAPIERLGELTAWPNSTPEESIGRVSDCEVLIVNKIKVNDLLLEAAPKLRLVCEAGTGINNIDVEACSRHGVMVRNVAGYSTDSVVQETFMHILNLLGNGAYFDNVVKSGAYSRSGCSLIIQGRSSRWPAKRWASLVWELSAPRWRRLASLSA